MLRGDSETVDLTNWYSWLAIAAVIIGSLMIINGAIQVYLKHQLASRIWSLSNRELGQLAVSLLSIVLFGVIGVLLLLAYWFLSLILSASFGVEASDPNKTFFLLALLSMPVAALIAIRLTPLPAYIADKNQFGVEASWEATRGYFWRIVVCLTVIILFYGFLWLLGAFLGSVAVVIIDGGSGEPSDAVKTWIRANLDVLVWPFTLYGQISVCALLGAIYKATTGARNETADVDAATGKA